MRWRRARTSIDTTRTMRMGGISPAGCCARRGACPTRCERSIAPWRSSHPTGSGCTARVACSKPETWRGRPRSLANFAAGHWPTPCCTASSERCCTGSAIMRVRWSTIPPPSISTSAARSTISTGQPCVATSATPRAPSRISMLQSPCAPTSSRPTTGGRSSGGRPPQAIMSPSCARRLAGHVRPRGWSSCTTRWRRNWRTSKITRLRSRACGKARRSSAR